MEGTMLFVLHGAYIQQLRRASGRWTWDAEGTKIKAATSEACCPATGSSNAHSQSDRGDEAPAGRIIGLNFFEFYVRWKEAESF